MTPPTTPPAIAPLSEEEPPGLGDALDEMEGLGDALDEMEGLGDKVAREAVLEAEDEVAATVQQETTQFCFIPNFNDSPYFVPRKSR